MPGLRLTTDQNQLKLVTVAGLGSLSGGGLFLAFPPVDWGPLAFIALIPLMLAFTKSTPRGVAVSAAAFGVTFFASHLYWIQLFGWPAYVAIIILEAGIVTLGLWLARRIFPKRDGYWVFVVAFLLTEYARASFPFGGFSWGSLGASQHDSASVLSLASIGGIWGLSLLVLATNAAVVIGTTQLRNGFKIVRDTILKPAWWTPRRLPVLIAGLVVLLLILVLPTVGPKYRTPSFVVGMIQGGAPESSSLLDSDPRADDERIFRSHLETTREFTSELARSPKTTYPDGRFQRRTDRPELIIWPESVVDVDPTTDDRFSGRLQEQIQQTQAPLLIGGVPSEVPSSVDSGVGNVSILLQPDGGQERYAKRHLVPFGEYLPLRGLFESVFGFIDELQLVGELKRGSEPKVFEAGEAKFAPIICFESTFADDVRDSVRQGAEFLVVTTNNISYQRTAASEQHVAFSQIRAAEHRMNVLHTALTGISAFIGPDGQIIERRNLFEEGFIVAGIDPQRKPTFYTRYGDWVIYLLILVAVVGTLRKVGERRVTRTS